MPEVQTRADRRAARLAEIDPTLAASLEDFLKGTPEDKQEQVRSAVAAFLAWIEATGKEFPGYDEAFEAYASVMDGTSAASTLPYVQLLLAVLGQREQDDRRGNHTAA